MKHLIFTSFLCLAFTCVQAQDIITKTNGSKINAKVLEVTPSEVKYLNYDNQSGPTYVTSVNNISSIRYENGTEDVFEDKPTNNNQSIGASPMPKPELVPDNVQNNVQDNQQDNTEGVRTALAKVLLGESGGLFDKIFNKKKNKIKDKIKNKIKK